MKININRGIFQQRNKNKIKYQKRKTTKAIVYSKHLVFFFKKIQSKQKSAKLKLNLINTTIEQNKIQEIVKINEKLGKKEEKMPTFDYTHFFLETLETANEQKTKKREKCLPS